MAVASEKRLAVLPSEEVRTVSDQIVGNRMLSSKPEGLRQYQSIEEKINQYLALISSPAVHKFPDVTPRQALTKHLEAALSPLKFPDTLSAREGVVELSHKLREHKEAIIGCGGTGAYVLDYVAKTHLEEIHLFDDDIVHVHTLFRLPGVYGEQHLGMSKVETLAEAYGHFHGGIKPHVERVDQNNIACLAEFDYVFVCVDDAPSRQLIAQACHSASVPFVDVGMGLNKGANGLYGFVRTSGGKRGDFDKLNSTQHLPAQITVLSGSDFGEIQHMEQAPSGAGGVHAGRGCYCVMRLTAGCACVRCCR